MKNTILLLIVSLSLVGCVSTNKTPAKKVILPPLPPGIKLSNNIINIPGQNINTNTLATAPRFTPASVSEGTGITTAPEIYEEPGFGKFFLCRVYQGPNTELLVERTGTFNNYTSVANYGCWGTEQVFIITTSVNYPYQFIRGRHVPCVPTFQPASAIRLGHTHNFKLDKKIVKAALVVGIETDSNFQVWKVLP